MTTYQHDEDTARIDPMILEEEERICDACESTTDLIFFDEYHSDSETGLPDPRKVCLFCFNTFLGERSRPVTTKDLAQAMNVLLNEVTRMFIVTRKDS